MNEQPQQPNQWSQVTSFLQRQNMLLIFMAIIAALFIAYNLAANKELSSGNTDGRNKVSPKPNESQSAS